MSYTPPTYEFRVRNARTLALEGEIRPQDVISAEWTRHYLEPSRWRLAVPRRLVDPDLIARQRVVEVRRDGSTEFVGFILRRQLDRIGETWELSGFDAKDWLRRRGVGPDTAVAKADVAETVAKAFVDENLGPGASTRAASGELTGKTFTVEADAGRGDAVDVQVRRRMLDAVLVDVLRAGGLWHDVVLTDAGWEYRVHPITDATIDTGAVPFSVGFDNVDALTYVEDYQRTTNKLYVMGGGTGDARTVREVDDASSVAADFLREGFYDARDASTNDELDQAGATEIERQLLASVNADVAPLLTSDNARYRDDWNIGTNVTIAIPVVDVTIDRPVVAATVSLAEGAAAETIRMQLGVAHARSQLRRIGDALAALQRAATG